MKTSLFTTERKKPEYYKGILIHADSMLHGQAEQLLLRYVSRGASVIDIGAGAGAFSQTMSDLGYEVTALDIDNEKFIPSEVPFIEADINRGILLTGDKKYDAAFCLEVVEHVENPWSLLREIYQILKPGGLLILSTPNVTSFLSRLIFLWTGQFHQFGDADLPYGHIRPITAFELSTIAHRLGWRILEISPGGYLPIFDFSSIRIKMLLFNVLRGIIYLLAKGQKRGWRLFFVLEKSR
jgi:SAM-dependent methyltransferase